MSVKQPFIVKDPEDPYYGCQFPMKFEEYGAKRRAALRLLPNIEDPEAKNKIVISKLKSSRKYKIDLELSRATNERGYRLCRCSRVMKRKMKYFWEFKFVEAKQENSHCRLGIATTNADMEAPIGVDEEGYCVRDLGGAYHNARRFKPEDYPQGTNPFPPFALGSTIGFGFTHTEEKETTTLEVFINGVSQGVIFNNIDPNKEWIPSFSCYYGAVVEAHFDNFEYDQGADWTPIGQIKNEHSRAPYTVQQMIDLMKNGTESLRTKQMFAATDAVLTPITDMPI